MNAPQVVNAQFQKTQERAAVEGEIAQEGEKVEAIQGDLEQARDELATREERVADEARQKATNDFTKRVQDARQKLFEKKSASDLLNEFNANDERELE